MIKKHYAYFILLIFFFYISAFIPYLEAAEIIYVEGAVRVLPVQEKAWKEAKKGMRLNLGDSIRTANRSKVDIILDEAKMNTVRIEQKTLVVLNASSPDFIDKIDLSQGKIYVNIENLKSGLIFEVSTPSAVAGVRGTGWSLYSKKTRDEVAVYEGDVYVKSFDARKNLISEIAIPEGFGTFIERFEAAGKLIQVSETARERWDEIKQEISRHIEEITQGVKPSIEQATEYVDEQKETIEDMSTAKEQIEEQKADETRQEQQAGHYY